MSKPALEDILTQRFNRAGARIGRRQFTVSGVQFDMEVFVDGRRHVVELKSTTENRIDFLRGLMSAALLQARRHVEAADDVPLPFVGVNQLTQRSVDAVREFMAAVAPEAAWGMIDRSGQWVVHGVPGLESDSIIGQRPSRAVVGQREGTLFTDLGQWMAKVLLAPDLRREHLAAPRQTVQRALQLAEAARVSPPTATRWLGQLRARGFFDDSTGSLRLVRRRDFLEQWRRFCATRSGVEQPARFTLPAASAFEQLVGRLGAYARESANIESTSDSQRYEGELRWKDGANRACLGYFAACETHGLSFVQGAPVHLYLESIDESSLRRFGLEPSESERAHVRVIAPHWPESVFRAMVAVNRPDGSAVPTSDVLQAWLDVSNHPARGREQAAEIERTVFAESILED